MKSITVAQVVKLIIGTIITASITGAIAWEGRMSTRSHDHETRINVIEEHQKLRDIEVDKSLDEIKDGQRRMEDKLDRALRRPR